MVSIENIVSKNVGKLGKRFLGGVPRKNAERAVSETANEVKDVFLKDKQKTVDSMLKNIETMKTNHVSEINKKDAEILELSTKNTQLHHNNISVKTKNERLENQNRQLQVENTQLHSDNISLKINKERLENQNKQLQVENTQDKNVISQLKGNISTLKRKIKAKMPFKLIKEDKNGDKTFAKANKNGAKMIKVETKDGKIKNVKVVLLDETTREKKFDTAKVAKPSVNIKPNNKPFETVKENKPITTQTTKPSIDIKPNNKPFGTVKENKTTATQPTKPSVEGLNKAPLEQKQVATLKPEQSTMSSNKNNGIDNEKYPSAYIAYPLRKYFIHNGLEAPKGVKPALKNIPKNGEIIEYDKAGKVLTKTHYVTDDHEYTKTFIGTWGKMSSDYKIYKGDLKNIEEYNPQTGKIAKRSNFDRKGYLHSVDKFNSEGQLEETSLYTNFRTTYDGYIGGNRNSYSGGISEFIEINGTVKFDTKTGKPKEYIKGKGVRDYIIATYTEKEGLKSTGNYTAGKWQKGTEGNQYPVESLTKPDNDRVLHFPSVLWTIKAEPKEAPLPEIEKVYSIHHYDSKTGKLLNVEEF